jgi:hypothetical protein
LEFAFDGEIFEWRGPAPFYYVAIPDDESADIEAIANEVTYGWGCIPVHVTLGETRWYTALFPKDGLYLVPMKAAIRKAERVDEGDTVTLRVEVG